LQRGLVWETSNTRAGPRQLRARGGAGMVLFEPAARCDRVSSFGSGRGARLSLARPRSIECDSWPLEHKPTPGLSRASVAA